MKRFLIFLVSILGGFYSIYAQSNFDEGYKEYRNGKFENSISLFSKSIEKREKVFESYLYRGMSYLFSEYADKCKEDLDYALKIDSTNVKLYVFYGRYYSATNQFEKAVYNYNVALKKDSKDYIIYSERAGAKCMLGMFDEAIIDAEIAVENLPLDYNVYLNRGFVNLRMDKYNDAIKDFSKSLTIEPSHKGYGNRGTAYALIGEYDLAIDDFEKALVYNPKDVLILFYKGEMYRAKGLYDQACECYIKSKLFGNNMIDDMIKKLDCK